MGDRSRAGTGTDEQPSAPQTASDVTGPFAHALGARTSPAKMVMVSGMNRRRMGTSPGRYRPIHRPAANITQRRAGGYHPPAMGREVRCTVRQDGREAEAKALLETDELIVRAPFGLKVARDRIASARVEGDTLAVRYDGGSVAIAMGEREAARWAKEIANPKTLADKLGVKPGQRVRLVGGADPALIGAGTEVADGAADVVFLAAESPGDLDLVDRLQHDIAPDGAIWVIRPK